MKMAKSILLVTCLAVVANMPVYAANISPAAPVVAASNPDALFHSKDPKLNANKQVVYNIYKVLLVANHWDRASEFLSKSYIQHNPNAASGIDAVVNFFTKVLKVNPKPIEDKLTMPIVAVIAEGDFVTVITPREVKLKNGDYYTTSWFDTWRIKNGKAVEHWDPALMINVPKSDQ